MKYCKECGHQVKEGAAFCPNCGAKITQASDAQNDPGLHQKPKNEGPQVSHSKGPNRQPRRPLSKQTKIIASAAGVLIILLIGGYFAGNSIYSKENTADAFEEAVTNEDTEALSDLLYSDDSDLAIDESTIDRFIDYLDEYPSYQGDLIDSVSREAEGNDSNENETAGEGSHFQIEKNGRKWLVFSNYEIKVKPFHLTLATEFEETELYMNDEKVATADSDEYTTQAGPYMTGIYSVEAKLSNEYADLEQEKTIDIDDNMTEDDVIDVSLDAGYTSVEADEGMKGTLIVDDNETDMKLGDEAEIGPVPLDGSVSLQIQHDFPWGKETSEEIPIEDQSVYIDEYPVSQELKDSLIETANTYIEHYADAFNALDTDELKKTSDDVDSNVSDDIERLKDRDKKRQIEYDKVVYDLESFKLSQVDDGYQAQVNNEVTSEKDVYDKDDDPDLDDADSSNTISFTYDEDEDEWVVDDLSNNHGSLSENIETFKMDDDEGWTNDDSDDE